MTRICIVTCYKYPDYIRAKTLRVAVGGIEGVELSVIKNSHKGALRYAQVAWQLLKHRVMHPADVYILTFRGYEALPTVRLLTIGKTLWYDEFINPIEWAAYEHKKIPDWKIFQVGYHALVATTQRILTDSESHADISAKITGTRREDISVLPVGADESLEVKTYTVSSEDEPLKVIFYGTMLPLHGVDIMARAAVKLKSENIEFTFIGAGSVADAALAAAKNAGAKITQHKWLEFEQLMQKVADADINLGGPFGDTFQAKYVITGKVYQALQMGRPVVVGSNKESKLFTDKQNCLLVKQGDAAALADAISWANTNRSKLADIGENGKKLYDEKLSVQVIREKIETLLVGAKKR